MKKWLIWNEPNQRRWLMPTTARTYVKQLLNPAYSAIHRAGRGMKVAGGVTAPRGSKGGLSPVDFIRDMKPRGLASTPTRTIRIRSSRRDTPFAGGCGHCETITMATLERLLARGRRATSAARGSG